MRKGVADISARSQRRKGGSSKKVHSEVRVHIEPPVIGGEHTTAPRNLQMIVGIDVNSGLLLAGWLVAVERLMIGHVIREHINTQQSTLFSNLGHINHRLRIILPKYLHLRTGRTFLRMDSIGDIARQHMLKGD